MAKLRDMDAMPEVSWRGWGSWDSEKEIEWPSSLQIWREANCKNLYVQKNNLGPRNWKGNFTLSGNSLI